MAYISTQEVRAIRMALKEKFGTKLKFGVRKSPGSHAVNVTVKSGTVDFRDIIDADGWNHVQVNQYHLHHYGQHEQILSEIVDVIKQAPADAPGGQAHYDNSDAQVDYFDTAFYFHVAIGDWDKPYEYKGK